jgi:hypothetical protein
MRIPIAVVLGGLCALGGCSPMASSRRAAPSEQVVAVRPAEKFDEKRADKLAETAWGQWHQANPEIAPSQDFIAGFKKGFADYLEGTSDGQAPPLPPSCYGPNAYESVTGRQAVLDWFRGFREGAVQARASGLRPDATAVRPTMLPAPPPNRRVHDVSPSEILVLPAIIITASGITWGEEPQHPDIHLPL